jgi:hypothetical protein
MSPITKLFKRIEVFEWTIICQLNAWDEIKNQYVQALILINPNWELEFHVHTNAFHLVLRSILAYNPTSKFDQPTMIVYKLGRSHLMVDAFNRLPNQVKLVGVSNQTTDAHMFTL